ncbi:periplasmic nitrate reductase, NapE protein [Thalassotalea aquiviva]|uniref:periplasmic nitrate reductase, NapE protein n=1 Tax=Thalassotalea aquiviva TaxID=3242415 RepID=UPI00352A4E10
MKESDDLKPTKKDELNIFLFITILLGPLLSVVIVGGIGFTIWMSQVLFFGPPTGG